MGGIFGILLKFFWYSHFPIPSLPLIFFPIENTAKLLISGIKILELAGETTSKQENFQEINSDYATMWGKSQSIQNRTKSARK